MARILKTRHLRLHDREAEQGWGERISLEIVDDVGDCVPNRAPMFDPNLPVEERIRRYAEMSEAEILDGMDD